MQLGKPKTRPVLLEDAAAEAYRTRIFAQTKSAFGVAYLLNWLGRDCGVSLSAVAPALSRQMKADLVSLFGLYRPLRNEALPEFWGAQADALDKLLASQNLSATDEVSISFKHRNFVGRIGKIDVDWENSGGDIASVEVILMQADEKQIAIPCRVQDGVIDGIRKTGNTLTRATIAKVPWYLASDIEFEFDSWTGREIAEFIGSEVTGRSKAAQQMRHDAATLLFQPWETDDDQDNGPFADSSSRLTRLLSMNHASTKLEDMALTIATRIVKESRNLEKFITFAREDD